MEHYIKRYLTPQGFDAPQLLHDDFWAAIKLLFNNGHYVSSSKLLMSFIDSIAYLDNGRSDGSGAFIQWLECYVDLCPLGISADELWEHRNSLLHMTNLDSRKVVAGKTMRLIAYIGELPKGSPTGDSTSKWFSLMSLIDAVAEGCTRFLESMNAEPTRWEQFFQRYDLVVSDARYEFIAIRTDCPIKQG